MNNKTIINTVLSFIYFLFFTPVVKAQQEMLSPLYSNQVIKGYLLKNSNANAALKTSALTGDTLSLPIYDDFSGPGIYPDPAIWVDSNVFINNGFSVNAPTAGMATFDGLDKYGDPYDKTFTTTSGPTDKLESKNINLFADNNGNQYTPADNITLSFYYQRRGLGDSPEYGDSLYLEFWVPDTSLPGLGSWIWQWGLDGGTFDFAFTRVFIPVTDPLYLKNGFKFRFQSYGSQTGSLDNWNLDYVILKKPVPANDILINDIGYQTGAHSIIKNYTSIPYDHYKFLGAGGQSNLMKTTDDLKVFNLFNTASAPSQANFKIIDQFNNLQFNYVSSGAGNIVIPASTMQTYTYPNPPLSYRFPDSIPGNFAEFELIDNLASPNQDFNKHNDTIRYRQIFENYYAYDDGSAEASYSLNTAPNGKLAYKFNLIKGDILRGLFIHWVYKEKDVSLKLFKIVVWQSLTPEVVLYQQLNQKPMYYDSINGFRYYKLDSIVTLPAGDIYIGLVQSAADELYLGFDRNIDSDPKMFYNVSGVWQNSQIPGSFMFRPVFGDSVRTTTITEPGAFTNTIQVYPNPASNYLYVQTSMKSIQHVSYEIIDITGRKVNASDRLNPAIDIRFLHEGLYFIRFYDTGNNYFSTHKFIISRH